MALGQTGFGGNPRSDGLAGRTTTGFDAWVGCLHDVS